ncbi:unnamed protein product [Allacma fusca]|uniref:Polyhomeotic-like protein 2 n=1 Tax=Allacma fusca TaxID=39272 RepID=A0A8J2PGI4_9HEXA|nr:unnamed protein product [Allacma fusca]
MITTDSKIETEKENAKSNTDDSEDSSLKHSKLPKAMVKPQVLTHVLGGFVIQESAEPFPMPRNGEMDEPPKKKAAISPTEEMGKCEMCGKVDVKAKFKKNKRFCSSACAKSSKSAAQQQQQNQQQQVQVSNNSIPNGNSNNSSSDKLKQKNRKWARGDGDADLTDETNSSVGETSSLSPNEDQNDDEPKVNPVKWNVSEVVEFVKSLPGCAEYAEDFAVQEIDGQALLLLKEDHLMSAMGMKLGPALKLLTAFKRFILLKIGSLYFLVKTI